ncbi:MAG: 30S ribosomal protein S12 methylthiotransferase RimO [Anaerolineales bacterium]|jgi:ribosomal protein S12 methylthiotransferase|nr:30S ribosomal protein S12 methylthiotransferase RimO [Anaerolineales bacterium]HJN40498.1 30S ribosomal protein S12 methylthiotransferase RimO [Anaerolineales bacterium]|tara:strand:+ start:3948 stop:5279 length:1332 start_codon:yes stop_codon:yes gene_type:complete
MMDRNAFYILSLGCAKNTVDSESMAQLLHEAGYIRTENPEQAEALIVNTCGFIGPARDESLQALRELATDKRAGQQLIATGCLSQRFGARLIQDVPGIDGILGTRRWMDIVQLARRLRRRKNARPIYHLPESRTVGGDEHGAPRVAMQGGSAYLKIADGCRRPCAFCAIPLIKGAHVSRLPESIIADTRRLQAMGVNELVLISQDTTDYGNDLGMKNGLAQLLAKLVVAVPDIPWIRIMYAYPGYVSDELIETMARHAQILPYLDMPLQHGHRETLRRMKRPANLDWVRGAIRKMRAAMPALAIRSTFIVGYPGETEAEFQTLLDFVGALKFDRVGAFAFSFEPGTASEPLGDPIPQPVKAERLRRLMELQERISLQKNQEFVGQTHDVLIEGIGDDLSVGRSYRDAPEIDGVVIVESELAVGEIAPVRITGALAHDLTGIRL